jgi:hypothetical protein
VSGGSRLGQLLYQPSCDFSRFNLIGEARSLKLHPTLKGSCSIRRTWVKEASAMAPSRLTLQPGDFFKDPLPRCDAYIMMEIIHDWPDEETVAILDAIHRAAAPRAALYLRQLCLLIPNQIGRRCSTSTC